MLQEILGWLDTTDQIAMSAFQGEMTVEIKGDGTPVTQADKAIEDDLRERLAKVFPGEPVVGEEQGGELPTSGAAWILDPIDGTKNFAAGIPVFATLIARWEDGELTDAVVSAPGLSSRWWADASGAYRNGEPIRVSQVASLAEASICTGGLDWAEKDQLGAVGELLGTVKRHRAFGDFWGYMLVAQGSMDAMIEFASLALWDIAAPRCILERAGGRATSLSGGETLAEGPALGSNRRLHDELLATLKTA